MLPATLRSPAEDQAQQADPQRQTAGPGGPGLVHAEWGPGGGPAHLLGAFGGGGLGAIAINYGYYRGQSDIMYVMVILLVLRVQIIQKIGERMSVKVDKTIRGGSSAPEENNNQQ